MPFPNIQDAAATVDRPKQCQPPLTGPFVLTN
jgi:hypothetical protein